VTGSPSTNPADLIPIFESILHPTPKYVPGEMTPDLGGPRLWMGYGLGLCPLQLGLNGGTPDYSRVIEFCYSQVPWAVETWDEVKVKTLASQAAWEAFKLSLTVPDDWQQHGPKQSAIIRRYWMSAFSDPQPRTGV